MNQSITPNDPVPIMTRRQPVPVDHRLFGMWTWLGSEILFFSALIGTYVHFKVMHPGMTQHLDVLQTGVATLFLLTSSYTVVKSLAAIREGSPQKAGNYLLLSGYLGLAFLLNQALEFHSLALNGVTLHSIFGSSFFVVTGFHGLHVFLGLAWMLVLLIAMSMGRIKGPQEAMYVEVFGLFWAFVDVVWIILFSVIYLIP